MLAARRGLEGCHLVFVVEVSARVVAKRASPHQKAALAVVFVAALCNVLLIVGQTAVGVDVLVDAAVAVATAGVAEIVEIAGTEAEATGEQTSRRESG
jgi:hypothetical protein